MPARSVSGGSWSVYLPKIAVVGKAGHKLPSSFGANDETHGSPTSPDGSLAADGRSAAGSRSSPA